ncbi:hypothetical protein [uncultured Anaerovibrio sp.]|uniref:hypothetical protein n=1 Tax=uncultured Anaerovibrio sp. TaxID=361586 RepID=UPI0025CC9470|nr:hypothetical protein [uncultured Anaerovibrio sp.]
MSKDIDFLIFYEVKNREFENIVLLRNELVRRKYNVEYVSFFERHDCRVINNFKNRVRVAVMPSLYHTKEVIDIVYKIAGKVDYIVNLRWEQVFRNATEINMNYYAYPTGVARGAIHCCWGERAKNLLIQAGVKKDNLVVTGAITLDFLRKDFDGYYLSKSKLFEKYNITDDKPVILFVSSFSFSTMSKRDFNGYLSTIINEEEKNRLVNFVKVEERSREKIHQWLIELNDTLDCTIIYRPHPVEVYGDGIEKLQQNGIFVIRDENIKQWFKCCDQVYMWYSTSAAEAYAANVKFAILRPEQIPDGEDLPIYKNVKFIDNYELFSKVVKNNALIEGHTINMDSMNDYYSITELPAYIRTAQLLSEVYSGDKCPKFSWEGIDTKYFLCLFVEEIVDFCRKMIVDMLYVLLKKNILFGFVKRKICNRLKKREDFYLRRLISVVEFESMQTKLFDYMKNYK